MLTDADRELITAAVDGELSSTQVAAFRHLVATTREAEALFRQLMGDSAQLKSLPRILAPQSLAPTIVATVSQLPRIVPAAPRRHRARRDSRVGWFPYAIAACSLIAVAAGSYWLASRPYQAGDEPDRFARHIALPKAPEDISRGSVAVPAETPRELVAAPRPAGSGHDAVATVPQTVPEIAPFPRSPGIGHDAVGFGPSDEPQPFRMIEARLPFLAPLSGFAHDDTRVKLRTELRTAPAFRLDLFAKDTSVAAQVFIASAKATGVVVTLDAVASKRLEKKVPSFWVIYVETMTAEDIERLLVQLAADTKGDKAGSGLSAAHLVVAGAPEQKDLRELFGTDVGLFKRPESGPRSVASGTADQITKTLQKDAHQALLVTHLPTSGRASPNASKEVKQFLAQRGSRTVGTIPLMIVIRIGP